MIEEMTQSYPGVLCSRCKEAIPISKKTAVLHEELKRGEVSAHEDTMSRAFTLRCKACYGESVYGIEQVREFEGSPRRRNTKYKAARA